MNVAPNPLPPSSGDGPILVRWIVDDGGVVERGDAICELETSFASIEVPAWARGTLKHQAHVGDVVTTVSEIARII